jgi:hypothetical protein
MLMTFEKSWEFNVASKKKEISAFKICMPSGWGFYNNFRFIHVRPAKNDSRRMVCAGRTNYSCREFFIRQMRAKFAGECGYWGNGSEIDSSKVYVGAACERFNTPDHIEVGLERIRAEMEKSLAILNSLESEYGWPKTRLFLLFPTSPRNIVPGCLFVGDRRWNRSPYLMSLYTLIIRLGHWDWCPSNLEGKPWPQVRKALKKALRGRAGSDRNFVRHSVDHWHLLLENFKHLFGYKGRAYQWSSDRLSRPEYSTTEGVHKLTTGTAYHERLVTKFNKLKRGIKGNASKKG